MASITHVYLPPIFVICKLCLLTSLVISACNMINSALGDSVFKQNDTRYLKKTCNSIMIDRHSNDGHINKNNS